jgi:hypothetical protein
MPDALQTLRGAITGPAPEGGFAWESLLASLRMLVVSAPPSGEVERLLLDLLHFEGQLPIAASSEIPHSMSAVEMLKSVAIQALARCAGPTYLAEMQRFEATAESPVLAGIARTLALRAAQAQKREEGPEAVAEVRGSDEAGDRYRPKTA